MLVHVHVVVCRLWFDDFHFFRGRRRRRRRLQQRTQPLGIYIVLSLSIYFCFCVVVVAPLSVEKMATKIATTLVIRVDVQRRVGKANLKRRRRRLPFRESMTTRFDTNLLSRSSRGRRRQRRKEALWRRHCEEDDDEEQQQQRKHRRPPPRFFSSRLLLFGRPRTIARIVVSVRYRRRRLKGCAHHHFRLRLVYVARGFTLLRKKKAKRFQNLSFSFLVVRWSSGGSPRCAKR